MVTCAAMLLNASPTSFGGKDVYGGGYSRDSWNVDPRSGTVWATVSGQHSGRDDDMVRSALREGRPVHVFRRDTRVSKMFTYHGVVSRGTVRQPPGGRTVFHLGIERPTPKLCGGPFRGSWFRAALESIGVDTGAMGIRTFMTCFYEFQLNDAVVSAPGTAPSSTAAATPWKQTTEAAGAGAGAGAGATGQSPLPAALHAAAQPFGAVAAAAEAAVATKESSR